MKSNRAFLHADGFFTTFVIENGKIAAFNHHYNRLVESTEILDFERPEYLFSPEHFKRFLAVNVSKSTIKARVRLSIWRAEGQFYTVPKKSKTAFSFEKHTINSSTESSMFHLVDVSVPRISAKALSTNVKWISGSNSILAQQEAFAKKGNVALQLSSDSFISETPFACVAWVYNDSIFTPSLNCDVLKGTTRADFIQFCAQKNQTVIEGEFLLSQIPSNSEWILLNAVFGAKTVSTYKQKSVIYSSKTLEFLEEFRRWRQENATKVYD